ncbi:hypothetical protein N431DRAFT_449335 [Stipitochalara longipes BDJ]|nr:hypothetical protein N431DRAFT_449335 [Stipitochalara longipes BDJ]
MAYVVAVINARLLIAHRPSTIDPRSSPPDWSSGVDAALLCGQRFGGPLVMESSAEKDVQVQLMMRRLLAVNSPEPLRTGNPKVQVPGAPMETELDQLQARAVPASASRLVRGTFYSEAERSAGWLNLGGSPGLMPTLPWQARRPESLGRIQKRTPCSSRRGRLPSFHDSIRNTSYIADEQASRRADAQQTEQRGGYDSAGTPSSRRLQNGVDVSPRKNLLHAAADTTFTTSSKPPEGREQHVSFPPTLELIPDGRQTFHSLWGSREVSRDNDKIELSSLGSESSPEFPRAEEGEKKGGTTSESGFREGHGKKHLCHAESLQEIKN